MKKKIIFIMSIFLCMFFSFQTVVANTNEDLPKFIDYAGLLTEDEGQELNDQLNQISKEQKMDVVIVTVNDIEGKTATQYADDFFDYNGYGQGEEHDGILLLVDMENDTENRKWAISTTGYGITTFTDEGQAYMVDQFKPYLSDGKYKKAFHKFADLSEDFIIQAKKGKPYNRDNLPKHLSMMLVVGEILICFVIALLVGLYQKSKLKTVVRKTDALDYMESGSLNMMDSRDVFVNQIVTSRVIPRNTSSGGSSTHTSSSGRTHGGSSGSF